MAYNRFQSNTRKSFSKPRFVKNTALVVSIGASGLLAPRFDGGLALPYASIGVETEAGKRYIIQVRGREAKQLDGVKVGMEVSYGGTWVNRKTVNGELRGGYFLASQIEISNEEISSYVTDLLAATEQLTPSAE